MFSNSKISSNYESVPNQKKNTGQNKGENQEQIKIPGQNERVQEEGSEECGPNPEKV